MAKSNDSDVDPVNIVHKNRSILEHRHYITTSKPDNSYWFGFEVPKVQKFQESFGDNFNLVVAGAEDLERDFFVFPFHRVKHLFTDETVSVTTVKRTGQLRRRWVGSIADGYLSIRKSKIKFPASEFWGASTFLTGQKPNSDTNPDHSNEEAVLSSAPQTRTWIFQAQPTKYQIRAALKDLAQFAWRMNQQAKHVHVGDHVYLWEAGPHGGLLARGRIASEVMHMAEPLEETPFRISEEERAATNRVMVEIFEQLREPVKRSVLKENAKLSDTRLLKVPLETNYLLSASEGAELSRLFNAQLQVENDWVDSLVEISHEVPHQVLWARDELIVALNLYFELGRIVPPPTEARVIEISQLLKRLPIHPQRHLLANFRSVDSVAMKLADFAGLDPQYQGKAFTQGSKLDKEVWDEFVVDQASLRMLAKLIHDHGTLADIIVADEEDDEGFAEGKIAYKMHRYYERDSAIVLKKKQQAKHLRCEACDFDFFAIYGDRGQGYIECHHDIPIHESNPGRKTKLSELSLLCANCHRIIHRTRPWLSVSELKELITEVK